MKRWPGISSAGAPASNKREVNFLSPAFLIGLPLVAIPLVIHLLSRRQQKRISWGAMRFLKEAITRKRRLWRLTDLLLLLLRTAVFLFFVFALARPLLPATWLGGSTPREIILVLDQSMSMSRKVGDTSLFDLQIEKANALLEKLTGRDSVRIILAGETPEWLTPDPVQVSPTAIRNLRTQVESLKPTLGAGDVIACVREAADLEAPKDKSARVIVVFSDRQRFGWRMDERPLWTAVQTRLQQAAIPASVNVQFLTEGNAETGNLCVNRIEVARPFAAMHQELNFTAHVQNRGDKPSPATLLAWRAGDQPLGVATIPELAPGASTSVSLAHEFAKPGLSEIACRLEVKDAMPADNEARVLVEVYERLPVLIVEEAGNAPAIESDSAFVLAALGTRKAGGGNAGWHSVFEPTVIEPSALAVTDLNRFRCIILADPKSVEPANIDKLDGYVRSGGGLWMALGAHTDEKFFNEHWYRGGLGLAPLKLTTAIGDPNNREKFFAVRASSETHPATALLSDFQRLDLDRARIYRRHQFDAVSGSDVSVLLEVQHDDPVVVERKLERGRVLVQSIPLGISWSTLPLCQAYVAMMHEWLWYLAEPALPKRNLAVGEAAIESANPKAVADLTLPDSRTIELQSAASPGGAQFRYASTRLPGEYALRVKEGDATTRFLVQRNPEESDLKPLSEQDVQQLRSAKGFQVDAGSDALAVSGAIVVPKHPLEGWLLGILACALLGELMLAGWLTQQRNLRLKPVTMAGT